jgi:hypothetical protein
LKPTPEAIPTLRVISAATASREGYRPITTEICPRRESAIFDSVQKGLAGKDAVWIEANRAGFMAGRKAKELLVIEALLSEDDRREGNGGKP